MSLPGGLVGYGGALYAFGGGTARHGTPEHSGDLTKMGALNDLWRYDPDRRRLDEAGG